MGGAILVAASVLLDAGDAGRVTDLRSVLLAAGVLTPAFILVFGVVKRLSAGYVSASEELGVLENALMATSFAMVALPIPASAWVFTAPDRSRFLAAAQVPVPGVRGVAR